MRWHLDPFTGNTISGWIYDPSNPDSDITVLAINGSAMLGSAKASDMRESLAGSPHKTHCGFTISLECNADPASVVLLACDYSRFSDSVIIYSADKSVIGTRSMPYQRFEELSRRHSGSNSSAKLSALALPKLAQKSVLDIGCNEGFFCQMAAKAGASRVLGIDQSSLSIEKARLRLAAAPATPDSRVEFRCDSWWNIPDETFDVILFLSAIHYEPEQKKLLDLLASRLNPDGILVLECGVIPGASENWAIIKRTDDILRFPTEKLLYSQLLSSYAVRKIGKSVTQAGDPLPRFVYHCSVRRPVVGIIRGISGTGKSTFAHLLKEKGIPTYASDSFFHMYHDELKGHAPATPMYSAIANELTTRGWNHAAEKLREIGAIGDFCRDFISCLPLDADLLFVEGEIFRHADIYEAFCAELKKRGASPWKVDKS